MECVIGDIPDDLDKALRAKACAEGKSIAQAAVDALRQGLSLASPVVRKRDLSDLCGASEVDPAIDRALEEFERVDAEQWK